MAVAAAAGAGKSAWALATAVRVGAPTLFFSADTTTRDVVVRLAAMLTGATQDRVETFVGVEGWEVPEQDHISWDFSSSPTLEHIDLELAAYEEMHGANPHLIVLDNLADVADGEDEWSGMRRANREIKYLARELHMAVLVLQHTNEDYHGGGAPSRWRVQGRDIRMPASVLTLGQAGESGWLPLGVVKNRHGKADPTGQDPVHMLFEPERMSIQDPFEMDSG